MDEQDKMSNRKVYESVQLGGRKGTLVLSASGISFCPRDDDDDDDDEDSQVLYQTQWAGVKSYRINSPTELEASLKLYTSANYGEGWEDETSIFALPTRTDLELLKKDIEQYRRQCDTIPSLQENNSDLTGATISLTEASSISCSDLNSVQDELSPEGKSLVLMVYEHLVAASERARRDFAQGVVQEQPDRVLKSIYERERERHQLRTTTSKGDDDGEDQSLKAPVKLSPVTEGSSSISDSENGARSYVSQPNCPTRADPKRSSPPPVREPKLLAGHPSSLSAPSRKDSREALCIAKQLDEQDRQEKERARAAFRSAPDEDLGSEDAIEASQQQLARVSAAFEEATEDAGKGVATEESEQQHQQLKQQLLVMLQQSRTKPPISEGPGAFPISAKPTASTPSSQDRSEENLTDMSDRHLIEAYLVAQSCDVSMCKAPEPPESTDVNEDIKLGNIPPHFWELSETEFLAALEKVMINKRTTEAVPVTDYSLAPVAALKTEVKNLSPIQTATVTSVSEPVSQAAYAPPTNRSPSGQMHDDSGCCIIL